MVIQNYYTKEEQRSGAKNDSTAKIFEEVNKKYEDEFCKPSINIVTTEKLQSDDDCEVANRITIAKYYTVRPKNYYEVRGYKRYYGKVYSKGSYIVKPRKFYNEAEVWAFLSRIEKIAGRVLEDAEKMLLLRTITKGRQYEMICVIDRTEELEKETMYKEL